MCMLSQPIDEIASTRIYCTELARGVHALVYQMEIATSVPVAMILPVPVLKGTGDDALTFVDLSGCRDFFVRLGRLFHQPRSRSVMKSYLVAARAPDPLVVHDVGDFVASYVPSLADFGRLDPQFRLDPRTWASLPDYSDFGFAVFQLKSSRGRRHAIHPMAYRYPADQENELFFPTVHVHDGTHADPVAHFDHVLFVQGESFGDTPRNWEECEKSPSAANISDTKGLMVAGRPVSRRRLRGMLPNADQVLVNDGSRVDHRVRGLAI